MIVKKDLEIQIMSRCVNALELLEPEKRSRVLRWLQTRYELDPLYLSIAAEKCDQVIKLEAKIEELIEELEELKATQNTEEEK